MAKKRYKYLKAKNKILSIRIKELEDRIERLESDLFTVVNCPLTEKGIIISLREKTKLKIEHSIWMGNSRN